MLDLTLPNVGLGKIGMALFGLCAIAALGLADSAHAGLHFHGGYVASRCPYDGGGFSDGCDAAPTNGNFVRSNFGTYAVQSSQTNILATHPMGWNVAGWDYAIGFPMLFNISISGQVMTVNAVSSGAPTINLGMSVENPQGGVSVATLILANAASGGTPCGGIACTGAGGAGTYEVDTSQTVGPINAAILNVPGTATLPTGCAYNATGSPSGGPWVACTGSGTTVSLGVTGAGWDFAVGSGPSKRCTILTIYTNSVVNPITIKNSMWVSGPGCNQTNSNNNMINVLNATNSPSFDFENNYTDYVYGSSGVNQVAGIVNNDPAAPQTYKYNVFLNAPFRIVNTKSNGDILYEYNYVEGIAENNIEHGEFSENWNTTTMTTVNNMTYSFNTILIPASATTVQLTAPFYVSIPGPQTPISVLVNGTVDHNTTVLNNTQQLAGAAVAEFGYDLVTNMTIVDNYTLPSYSNTCFATASPAAATFIQGSTTGNTFTVTSLAGSSSINAGAQISSVSATTVGGVPVTPFTILAYGTGSTTGTGGTGTYAFSGDAQAATSTGAGWYVSNGNVTTGGTFTMTGNVSLADGSAITGIGNPNANFNIACAGY